MGGSYIQELCSHGRQIGVESARTAEMMVGGGIVLDKDGMLIME